MMGKILKFIAGMFTAAVICAAVCFGIHSYNEYYKELEAEFLNEITVGVSKTEFSDEAIEYIDLNTFESYVSKFDEYNSRYYYSQLTPQEQFIYRVYEYALDNNCCYILFDSRIIPQSQNDVGDILKFFSLDTPYVEQNIYSIQDSFTVNFVRDNKLYHDFRKTVTGTCIELPYSFTADKLEKKAQAVYAAKQVTGSMPQGMSDVEKAKYIFDYLDANTQYYDYGDTTQNHDFLYDMMCLGKSNCDGYANAFSLMCSMCGLDSFEKMFTATGESGHTWNCVKLDGKWYNVDCTNADSDNHAAAIDSGFPDALCKYKSDYAAMMPVCDSYVAEISGRYASVESNGFLQDAAECLKSRDTVYFVLASCNEATLGDVLQRLCNTAHVDISCCVCRGSTENVLIIELD